jgi:thiol-disulfide isomerase/thioredoxin
MRTSLGIMAFTATAALLSVLGAELGRAAQPELPPPRYQLKVGQELIYKGSSLFQYEGGAFDDRTSWQLWVTRSNDDGSWRLFMRQGSVFVQKRAAKEEKSLLGALAKAFQGAVADEVPLQPEEITFAYCDLFPDGRIVANDTFGLSMHPDRVLPLLPRDVEQARQGWVDKDQRLDESTHYRMLPQPPQENLCQIEAVRESPMDAIYGMTHREVITLDRQRGLPEKIESETKQTYGFKGHGRGTFKLVEVKMHDAAWCKQVEADMTRYFAAKDAYQKVTEDTAKGVEELKTALEKAVTRLQQVQKELQLPELKKTVEADVQKHEQLAKYYLEAAENRAQVLHQPAADWATTDLDGKKHALQDYRGKVVILDFWYRGCGWCVRAMPQMKQVASHFQGQPVVVFGMNTDRNLDDAKFVVEKMGLNYTNLKAEGLPQKYHVQGFPTLIIIDRKGVVRDLRVGYSPTLKQEVIRSVEKLLK